MLKNIRSVCSGMFELIEKLLQYAVTAKTEPEFLPVDMSALVTQTYQEIMTAVEDRQVELVIEDSLPQVSGDAILLKQVLYNILSNAIKFTRYQNKAIIRVSCHKTQNQCQFSFKDNGVGFNMAYSTKLFGIFQRMHSQSEFEGSGIGLATVKKIVEKHGGSVSIFSEEGLGTTVSFTLPLISH
jgi:light-regulated signal transduction histidine kinase (bacteriophytochrome)